jgi:hypothetical protein
MKNFVFLVSLILVAVLVVPSYAGKPATRLPSGIRVYDANDQFLGLFLGFMPVVSSGLVSGPGYVEIFVPALNYTVAINVYGSEGWRGNIFRAIDAVDYETNDCTGPTAYPIAYGTGHTPAQFLDIYASVTNDMRFRYYRPVGDSILKTITVRSSWTEYGCVNRSSPEEFTLFEATEIPESAFPFTLPVALPLRYELN